MIRAAVATLLVLAAADAAAFEKLGVVAVADPPSGPDADLAELAHQLRAACRDRIGGVEEVPTMRARLLGQTSNATLSELDRAYGGALAVFQNGEFESALRTLHAIVDDLENLPETDDSYSQWLRAQLRLAHAAFTIGREAEGEAALYAVAKTDITITPDLEQYSPTYRRRYEAIRSRVRALPGHRLTVTSEGAPGTVFVNGRPMGMTPLALRLAAGKYRIGGQAGDLRVPSFGVDLRNDDRAVVLDFGLAESLRVNAGPGLALPLQRRGDGIVRAGAWLIVDKLIAVSRVYEGQAAFLLGSIYDVRRGALLREGSVRMIAGSVPAANIGALAAFLLTGQASRDVKELIDVPIAMRPAATPQPAPAPTATAAAPPREPVIPPVVIDPRVAPVPPVGATPPPPTKAKAPQKTASAASSQKTQASPSAPAPTTRTAEPSTAVAAATPAAIPAPATKPSLAVVPPPEGLPPPASAERTVDPSRRWMRTTAIGSGIAAGALAVLAVQQALASSKAYSDADAMVGPDGTLVAGSDPGRYRSLRSDGDAARRNSYISAGASIAFAAAAGILGWRYLRPPEPGLAFRF